MSPALDDHLFLKAVAFAARAHGLQRRKDGVTPYFSHPCRVCLIVRDLFEVADRQILMAALLHDTIEDTLTDFDDLAAEFGPEVARWVACLTKDKRVEENQREEAYLQQLWQAPWQVQVCKLADIYDNLLDLSNLPSRESQQRSLKRARQYLSGFAGKPPEQLRRPLERVHQLLVQIEGQHQG